jgi:hypothetical protein
LPPDPIPRRGFVIAGAAAGAVVWAYDYDFFFNAAGPATPLSNAILRAGHLEHAAPLVWLTVPAAVLISAGALLGLACSRVMRRLR